MLITIGTWSTISTAINTVQDMEPPVGYPWVDFDQAFHACTDGVLLACDHQCSFELVSHQSLYNNHPGLEEVTGEVRE
jgi:hypothetical protein